VNPDPGRVVPLIPGGGIGLWAGIAVLLTAGLRPARGRVLAGDSAAEEGMPLGGCSKHPPEVRTDDPFADDTSRAWRRPRMAPIRVPDWSGGQNCGGR
jgi:hypothetical protein